jgi:hypothetical protein
MKASGVMKCRRNQHISELNGQQWLKISENGGENNGVMREKHGIKRKWRISEIINGIKSRRQWQCERKSIINQWRNGKWRKIIE